MKLITMVYGFIFILTFITCILFVLFGQVTVRKLRKNPETKDHLGVQFVHGWDIINAAQALSLPRWFCKKLENTPGFFLHANSELLYKHTTKFDRFLARLFYVFFFFGGLGGIVLVMLGELGFFE
jgi:hypothetical protein